MCVAITSSPLVGMTQIDTRLSGAKMRGPLEAFACLSSKRRTTPTCCTALNAPSEVLAKGDGGHEGIQSTEHGRISAQPRGLPETIVSYHRNPACSKLLTFADGRAGKA